MYWVLLGALQWSCVASPALERLDRPLLGRASKAFRICLTVAQYHRVDSAWSRLCQEELVQTGVINRQPEVIPHPGYVAAPRSRRTGLIIRPGPNR